MLPAAASLFLHVAQLHPPLMPLVTFLCEVESDTQTCQCSRPQFEDMEKRLLRMQLELGWVKKESRLLSAGLSDRAERVVNWNIHSFWVQRQAESFRSCVWVRAVDVNYG